MLKKNIVIKGQIKALENKITDTAKRLNLDLSNDAVRDSLISLSQSDEEFNFSEMMDGINDAKYFLSMALNLCMLLEEKCDEENMGALCQTFFLVGLVNGIIGDDRTQKACPACIVKSYASQLGKYRADIVHNKPNGSRAKRAAIQMIWASGKYSSRDICAEQECAGLEMSFSTARKALRGTPDPKR